MQENKNYNAITTRPDNKIAENTDYAEIFFEIVEKRRSIRKYKPCDMPQEDLKKILNAARLAPSARNAQPWRFIVVKDQKMKGFIAKSIGPQDHFAKASAVIVVLGDQNIAPDWYLQDPMIAAEHLVLAATALGYGTCWIGALADWVPENTASVKQALKIPEETSIVCIIAIGVADEKPRARPRNALQEICYEEVYGKPSNFL